jgi:hypothetical protein
MSPYLHHFDLFDGSYLNRVLQDPAYPRKRELPDDGRKRLKSLLEIWLSIREQLVEDLPESKALSAPFVGLPPTLRPLKGSTEAAVENGWVAPVLQSVLGYEIDRQKTLVLDGLPKKNRKTGKQKRPDMVVFRDKKALNAAGKRAGSKKKTIGALSFCRDADWILDAKKFGKGVGADEGDEKGQKDSSAAEDIEQLLGYLQDCGKTWGILTNGRSWRLMRAGKTQEHLRFDLVMFVEEILRRENRTANSRIRESMFTDEDLREFALFFYFFGPPAVGGGYLDLLHREGEANTRRVSEILRQNAHDSVLRIAEGFWRFKHPPEGIIPAKTTQAELDHLRELALTFLYRLLFILKAEAQGLLPMWDGAGAETNYAKRVSTRAVFEECQRLSETEREASTECFGRLRRLFRLVNDGGEYDVPAYNGGLFDTEIHTELENLRFNDQVVFRILRNLIYLDDSEPVPYADLDVRDFGDIYEGLLEQRLTLEKIGRDFHLSLRNKKGERKASGSYFTPDSLVEHLVRETLNPLLAACKADPHKILSLKVVDPAMGSGHFLVKAVDEIAWHLTLNCAPIDKGAPDDNGPPEYAYWKRKVVENCIYGVDVNPMAVELAKVALWLHSAKKGRPLSFLDHHLKCGNSLVGADLRCISQPGLERRERKAGPVWVPAVQWSDFPENASPENGKKKRPKPSRQLGLPFPIDTNLFSGILESVGKILHRPSQKPEDIRTKRRAYGSQVYRRLEAHRLLCDLWCAQWFLAEPGDKDAIRVYVSPNGTYNRVKTLCGNPDDEARAEAILQMRSRHPFLRKIEKAREEGYGPRPLRFFHWQLEFPEVAFSESGELRNHFGFDAVVGNPPWDKIKPAKRDFYGPFNEEVANRQGTSLDRLIAEMEREKPGLAEEWTNYEKQTNATTAFLSECGAYNFQTALVDGKKTGGDPDLFRYFTERAWQCARRGGRVGFLVPCTLWQGQGCTGLRRLLFGKATMHSLYAFENYRKWAFEIDTRFKFTAFVFSAKQPPEDHSFPAAFMLRDTQVLEGQLQERVVKMSKEFVETTSPDSLALIDVRSDGEARFIEKIHRNHPPLGDEAGGWNAVYRRELDMTMDSWRFKPREWMKERGFTQFLPVRDEPGVWKQTADGPATAKLPKSLPPGGEYWIAADAAWYRKRGYAERTVTIDGREETCFIKPGDVELENRKKFNPEKDFRRIFPNALYAALYEGRMVHIFDHAQKRYLRGEGRKAIWEDIPIAEKALQPRVFASPFATGKTISPRIGFCDITGATNERTVLSTLIGGDNLAGNKVPTLTLDSLENTLVLQALLGSFCADALIRLRVSTTLNWIYFSLLAVPSADGISEETKREILEATARLNCTTPELSEFWDIVFPESPWTYDSAERDLWKRAELRAQLDAIAADLYGLTVEEYARILTGFPLLDRDQPPLPGDAFLTEGSDASKSKGEEGRDWIETDWGVFELKPRSFITRDFALSAFMDRKDFPKPENLHDWYRDAVGLDPEGALSRFRVGQEKDLMERIHIAKTKGAIPYIPSGSGLGGENGGGFPSTYSKNPATGISNPGRASSPEMVSSPEMHRTSVGER